MKIRIDGRRELVPSSSSSSAVGLTSFGSLFPSSDFMLSVMSFVVVIGIMALVFSKIEGWYFFGQSKTSRSSRRVALLFADPPLSSVQMESTSQSSLLLPSASVTLLRPKSRPRRVSHSFRRVSSSKRMLIDLVPALFVSDPPLPLLNSQHRSPRQPNLDDRRLVHSSE